MISDFYKLWDEPFGVTPDPAYLYPSQTHLRALDSLRDGIVSGRGFMTLIADPGMGKTTLLYQLIEQMPQTTRTAYLFQTQCNSLEFMQYLLTEIGVDPSGMGLVAMHRRLNEMLFNEMVQGKQFLLIVDESQNLSNAVLETIRLLSNFETAHSKLLQIVLAGQTQLASKLKQPELSQLLQRINVMASLDALSFEETAGYIRHRLKLAGHTGADLFDPAALAAVYRRSQGIPRNINRICHAALSQAQAEKVQTVSSAIVEKSNRGLGNMNEELQKTRLASRPRPLVSPNIPTLGQVPAIDPVVSSVQPAPSRPIDSSSSIPEAQVTPPPETSPTEPRLTHPSLPDLVPTGRRRSYRSLVWLAVFVALPILVTLATPVGIRQAILQKLHPIVDTGNTPNSSRPDQIGNPSPSGVGTQPARTSPSTSASDTAQIDPSTKGLKFVFVIDPGHGGGDAGTRGPNGLVEKSVCLEVALRLGQLIEDNISGAEVVFTRNDDQDSSLQHRTSVANDSSATLFISIHADPIDEDKKFQIFYSGTEIKRKSARSSTDRSEGNTSAELADDLLKALAKQFTSQSESAPTLAVAQPAFELLNNIRIPAVLVEIPFRENVSPLLDPTQRQRIADGLYQGVAEFTKATIRKGTP